MYLKRPDLSSVDEEYSIEYADDYNDEDDNEGEDLISVFGEGVFQVAVKCRELSGIGHSLQSSFILWIMGWADLWGSLDDYYDNNNNDDHPPNNHPA